MKHLIALLIVLLVLSISFLTCNKGKNNPDSCNGKSTRREVKLLIDDLAKEIDTIPIITTVDSLGGLSVSKADKNTKRMSIEKKVFSITATVHKLSKHRDGDWKVKLTNGNDKFINCESPNMGCEHIEPSLYFEKLKLSREWIESNKEDIVGKTVTITGVAFVDIKHPYPRNAAENNMELHPILDIHY